jgi:serine/threonine-protein kinase
MTDHAARKRLRNEALSLSKLNHPNIATVFDFDSCSEIDFIVMELITGKSLSEQLKGGNLSEAEAFQYADQILEGLKEAHEHGIAHYDLKPSNIMLARSGQLKLLDFGIARLVRAGEMISTQSQEEIARFGGTLPYMAPETLRGNPTDTRADIWSFGVLLFQMVAGTLPFDGCTPFEISSAILHQSPRPLPSHSSACLKRAISGCLVKDPAQRFQSICELETTLRIPAAKSMANVRSRRSYIAGSIFAVLIVVAFGVALRFVKVAPKAPSPQPLQLAILQLSPANPESSETMALGAGLVETLTAQLARSSAYRSVQVIPSSEIRSKHVMTLRDAHQELGADLALEFGIHRVGDRVRVNYLLLDAKTDKQLRGDTVTTALSESFELEDRVTQSVVAALQSQSDPTINDVRAPFATKNAAAYTWYLKGQGYLRGQHTSDDIDQAIDAFKRALVEDGVFGMAYAGLGESYWSKYELEHNSTMVELATNSCKSAVELSPGMAGGYICLGTVFNGTGHYERGAEQFTKALSLDPIDDDALAGVATAYEAAGKNEAAENALSRAIELRPQYWRNYNLLGANYVRQGKYRNAAEMFQKVTELVPKGFRGYSNLGGAYIFEGNYPDAIAALQKSIGIRPTGDAYSNLATAYFHLRQFDDAAHIYQKAIDLQPTDYTVYGNSADALYYAGKHDEAKIEYQRAIALGKQQLEVNSNDVSVLSDLADYYSMNSDRERAVVYVERALKLAPRNPQVLFEAALVYGKIGQLPRSIQLLRESFIEGYSRTEARDSPALDELRRNPEVEAVFRSDDLVKR